MSRFINNYDDNARNFVAQELEPASLVELVVRENPQPEGFPALIWFYVHVHQRIFVGWQKTLYEELSDGINEFSEARLVFADDVDWELTRYMVHSVIKSMTEYASKRGYDRSEGLKVLRTEMSALLAVRPENLRQQIGDVYRGVEALGDDQTVLQVEMEMRQESIGKRTWKDAEQENLSKYLQKVRVFLSHAAVGQYPHAAAAAALLHKAFGFSAFTFAGELYMEAQKHVRG